MREAEATVPCRNPIHNPDERPEHSDVGNLPPPSHTGFFARRDLGFRRSEPGSRTPQELHGARQLRPPSDPPDLDVRLAGHASAPRSRPQRATGPLSGGPDPATAQK